MLDPAGNLHQPLAHHVQTVARIALLENLLARALPMTVAPLLTVLFTHRSGEQGRHTVPEHLKLLGLYAVSLAGGASCLFLLRSFFLGVIARNTPEAATMITPFVIAMVFIGLLQALALWSLASRWMKISILYGCLGLGYWLTLLVAGTSPAKLLNLMPVVSGFAFAVLFVFWLLTMRRYHEATES